MAWIDNALTQISNGSPAGGWGPNGYWGSDNSPHVNYYDAGGHVHELHIAPGAGWVSNDLTQITKDPLAHILGGLAGTGAATTASTSTCAAS